MSRWRRLAEWVPVAALTCSALFFGAMVGTLSAEFNVFPYTKVHDALRTFRELIKARGTSDHPFFGRVVEATSIPAHDASRTRWTIFDSSAPRLPVLAFGGLNQYREHCPEFGCLAVAFDAALKVSERWPYRPAEIQQADITRGAFPHEIIGFEPRLNKTPIGIEQYRDGDILVIFQGQHPTWSFFPFGMGVARIGHDGAPRWTRFDYSHHWSTLAAGDLAYVPTLSIGKGNVSFTQGVAPRLDRQELRCATGRPHLDAIQEIDSAGRVVEQIDLISIFVNSNMSGQLLATNNACDPLHLNYIDVIKADAGPDLLAGDLVISLRNVSRFAILDPRTRRIKRVVSGGFIQQHSVRHLEGTRFLLFDNLGGDAHGPASRIVEIDLATGVERRVFPNVETPEPFRHIYTEEWGYLDISPDRRRVLASVGSAGRAFEIDIATGRLLAVFDNVHDVSTVPEASEEERKTAQRFAIFGVSYFEAEH